MTILMSILYGLMAVAVIAALSFGIWYLARRNVVNDINGFATQVQAIEDGLRAFKEACASRPGLESAYVELGYAVREHAATLDLSFLLIREAARLATRVDILNRSVMKRLFPVATTAEEIKGLRTRLLETRRDALSDINTALTDMLPDMREKLSQLPVQGGTIAIGALSLVGLVWMSGFYGVLGVPFIPLIRELKDVVLVGLGAGVLPLIAFTGMAAVTLHRIWQVREIARRRLANSDEIYDALMMARRLRRPTYWAWRAFLCLLAVFVTSLAAATVAVVRAPNSFDVAVSDKPGVERLRLLGGVGDYYVLIRSSDRRVVTLPKARLECFETSLPAEGYCAQPAPAAEGSQRIELTLNQQEDWRSYVQRVAQCWVVLPATQKPLLSPAFVADKSESLYLEYYQTRKNLWPYGEACSANPTKQCALDQMHHQLEEWISTTLYEKPPGAALHIVGFASGTATPGRNVELSLMRAEYIANELITRSGGSLGEDCAIVGGKDNGRCAIDIQVHGMGEMPRFNWAGTQGDPTEQVVLVAACNNDTL